MAEKTSVLLNKTEPKHSKTAYKKPLNLSKAPRLSQYNNSISYLQRAMGNQAIQTPPRPSKTNTVKTRHQLQPHTDNARLLAQQAAVYRRDRTPIIDSTGHVRASHSKPLGAASAGRDLGEIHRRFGDTGLARTIRGLTVTRGQSFTASAVRQADSQVRSRTEGGKIGQTAESDVSRTIGGETGTVPLNGILRSTTGKSLPVNFRSRLGNMAGDALTDVRVHDDHRSHQAAATLNAKAFTVGRNIYFGEGQYRPNSHDGAHLLAHEVAHTVQQREANMPVTQRNLAITTPGSSLEREADHFAGAVTEGREGVPALTTGALATARVMRVISFTRAPGVPAVQNPGVQENATGTHFQIGDGVPAAPYFSWAGDYTINGSAGDPFASFNVGPQQVVRSFWLNVWWGTGTNRTWFRVTPPQPIRDETGMTGTQTWYHDPFASTAYGADGDIRSTSIEDTPGVPGIPLTNPVATRVSNRGWFNWGMAFVAYLGAQDGRTPGPGGWHPLNHVWWNTSLAGNFDTNRAVGARLQVTTAGQTNTSKVITGNCSAFPVIFGTDIFNRAANNPTNHHTT